MQIINVRMFGRDVAIAAREEDITVLAKTFEQSENVLSFYVKNLNVRSQPSFYNLKSDSFKKWLSPIEQ